MCYEAERQDFWTALLAENDLSSDAQCTEGSAFCGCISGKAGFSMFLISGELDSLTLYLRDGDIVRLDKREGCLLNVP